MTLTSLCLGIPDIMLSLIAFVFMGSVVQNEHAFPHLDNLILAGVVIIATFVFVFMSWGVSLIYGIEVLP